MACVWRERGCGSVAPLDARRRPRRAHIERTIDPRGESAAIVLMGVVFGLAWAAALAPHVVPALRVSVAAPEPKAFWFLSRAAGLSSYALLWLSMVVGLSITNRFARIWPGGPTALDLHNFTGLLGLAVGLAHALVLLGDRYIGYTVAGLMVPYWSTDYRPGWVALGQIGLYLAALVGLSFYARRLIGHHVWRSIHYASFAVFVLVTGHALGSGTDTGTSATTALYSMGGVSVVALAVCRIVVRMNRRRHRAS